MQIKEISSRADIPQNYLEQLLILLRQAGLVQSVRGAWGLFAGKSANEILIKDIFIALEGSLLITDADIKDPVLSLFYEESTAKMQEIFRSCHCLISMSIFRSWHTNLTILFKKDHKCTHTMSLN